MRSGGWHRPSIVYAEAAPETILEFAPGDVRVEKKETLDDVRVPASGDAG